MENAPKTDVGMTTIIRIVTTTCLGPWMPLEVQTSEALQCEPRRYVFLNFDRGRFFDQGGSYPRRCNGQPAHASHGRQSVESVADNTIGVASYARYGRIGMGKASKNDWMPSGVAEVVTAGERKISPVHRRTLPSRSRHAVRSPSRQNGSIEFIVVKDGIGICEWSATKVCRKASDSCTPTAD